MKKNILLAFVSFVFMSCYNNAFDEILFRTTEDPFDEAPAADSMKEEHKVFLSWTEDAACDEYILMRASDSLILDFKEVYSGTGNSFVDTDTEENALYIYRLDKIRGKKRFTGKSYGYGWWSDCRRDACEPNDEESESVWLKYQKDCNLAFVRYSDGKTAYRDTDWFYVYIPAQRCAEIAIFQEGCDDRTETDLEIIVLGKNSHTLIHGDAVQIQNETYEDGYYYFKIQPKISALPGKSGSTAIEYTVRYVRMITK